jgi:hypothetical protein
MSSHVITDVSGLASAAERLQKAIPRAAEGRFAGICGFDGFIDTFIRMEEPATMAEFGPKISAAAGIAASYAAQHQGDKFGGNGPLLASALSDILGPAVDVDYIGALGQPDILPIFSEALAPKIRRLYSLAAPAHSDCLEFEDGKVMLCDMRSCADVTWEALVATVGEAELDELLRATAFIGAVNWGKLPNVGVIWKNLSARLSALGRSAKDVAFFMDLAEFEQRPETDRRELLELVAQITEQCHSMLSFNLKEAWQMAATLGGDFHGQKAPESVVACAAYLQERIDADRIIIHPNDGAACASPRGSVYIPGPYCASPLISTGAGDNFGAGCLAAALLGLDDAALLLAGVCASGYFVRSGRSASWASIIELHRAWAEGRLAERL